LFLDLISISNAVSPLLTHPDKKRSQKQKFPRRIDVLPS
jgi:hypothetical protein